MEYAEFGNTDLLISKIGFGAWAIGGAAVAGNVPISYGSTDEQRSIKAIERAVDLGVNFFDTADFYGLGRSEELLGKVLRNKNDILIASKVGHRLDENENIFIDYSKAYILEACEKSLRRLKRDHLDLYQLHTAKLDHLKDGGCIEAMEQLKKEGKIRYWGLSVNTFDPEPEGEYLMDLGTGSGFQVVYNIINQRARNFIKTAAKNGYGIIARMPLQFGLLTGKFNKNTTFEKTDHRTFRLTKKILKDSMDQLESIWPYVDKYGISKTSFSLSFLNSYPGITTIIPGIRTAGQIEENTSELIQFEPEDIRAIEDLYDNNLYKLVETMENQG